MKILPRILASGIALTLVAAACGGAGTGEGPAQTTEAPTVAPATQAAATPAPTPFKAQHLVVLADTVRGSAGLTDEEKKGAEPYGLICVVQSRYPQGSRIVWRVRVLDPLTEEALDDQALEYVTLTLPDGTTQGLKYGGHGGTKEDPADHFWATGWTVPEDYPTGVFDFKLEAKSLEGAVGVFGYDFFKVTTAQLQIIPADLGTRRF